MSSFPLSEADMYPLIRDYFLNVLKFDKALVDDGNEQFVRLRKNLHAREVDIVAVKDPNDAKPRVDLVEAKAFAKGNSFEECFSQIDSIRDSGDRLWVAFPENQWNALALIDRRRNESRLNDFDFGLLLVSETECYAEIKAQPNRQVTETGRAEVLEQLGFPQDVFLPSVQTLGMPEAAKAAGIMGLICMVADIVNDLEAKKALTFSGIGVRSTTRNSSPMAGTFRSLTSEGGYMLNSTRLAASSKTAFRPRG